MRDTVKLAKCHFFYSPDILAEIFYLKKCVILTTPNSQQCSVNDIVEKSSITN